MDLTIPKDAFSDGQIRSKLWLSHSLNLWNQKYALNQGSFSLTWYGSWVGVGPLMLLSLSDLSFSEINLLEIDKSALDTSEHLLNYWICKGLQVNRIFGDMNNFEPIGSDKPQIFVNTACEHVTGFQWLEKIPKNAFVLLQSTNMPHIEHVNCCQTLKEFKNQLSNHITILETDQLDFRYPNFEFSRFMIFGRK